MGSAYSFCDHGCAFPESSFVVVPSLKTALLECDRDLLSCVVVDQYLRPFASKDPASRVFCKARARVRSSLELVCQAKINGVHDSVEIIVPRETFLLDAASMRINRRIEACFVNVQDLECGAVLYDDPQVALGFSGQPWEQILLAPVWYVASFCEQEKYMMLASVYWELARSGSFPPGIPWAEGGQIGLSENDCPGCFSGKAPGWNLPAGFDWHYRQRMRSRVIELNRHADERLFLMLKGMSEWGRSEERPMPFAV